MSVLDVKKEEEESGGRGAVVVAVVAYVVIGGRGLGRGDGRRRRGTPEGQDVGAARGRSVALGIVLTMGHDMHVRGRRWANAILIDGRLGKKRSDAPRSGRQQAGRYGLKAFDAATRVGEASSLADETFHSG